MAKARGKKQNALKHGVYSREMMLPGERLSEYLALRAAHYEEYQPDGVTEQLLVDDIFVLQWKKRRLESYNQIRLNQRVVQAHTDNEANRHGKILKGLAPEFSKATSVEAVEQIFSLLSPVYVEVITSWVPRDKCKDPTKWGQAIGKVLSDLKPEILQDPGLFATIVNPDLMDIELSRSLRLDEAIDRKIKRLMQVKTAKQIFPSMRKTANSEPKLINPPRDADRQSARITEDEQYPATHAEIAIVPESDGGEDRFERKYDPDVKGNSHH